MDGSNDVRVLALASAAEVLGWSERRVALQAGDTLGRVIERLAAECPALGRVQPRLRYAVNRRYADPQAPVQAGDEIALIPPVSGG